MGSSFGCSCSIVSAVCSINGHRFSAGLFFAMACDYRIMRTKRGYLNFEVNLGMRLQKQFGELAKCKLAPGAVRKAVLEHIVSLADEAKKSAAS